jgi:hypothetical protein
MARLYGIYRWLSFNNHGEPSAQPKTKGPEPERLNIEGNWIAMVERAFALKKPAKGWAKQ